MRQYLVYTGINSIIILSIHSLQLPTPSAHDIHTIGKKIWKNECNNSTELLVFWNAHEAFPSFGIGHFIWLPTGYTAPFTQTFPALLTYFKHKGVALPEWLTKTTACPWNSRAELYATPAQTHVKELRSLLEQTIDLQAEFIVHRLHDTLSHIVTYAPHNRQTHLTTCIRSLIQTSAGYFALLDYLNFKGDGTNPQERYEQYGWGLLQVLNAMDSTNNNAVHAFITSARTILEQRVKHAPNQTVEQRFLPGWINRVNSYAKCHDN